jgi:putative ABC transport system permease protein
MFVNYLKIAFRSLQRQKYYTIINLVGLSIGIAAFLMISLYIQHELAFDKHLSKRDRIFRVVEIQNEPGVGEQHVAITMGPLAKAMKEDFPQVVNTLRLMGVWNYSVVNYKEKFFVEEHLNYADPSIIEMFDIPIVIGDPKQVLADPKSVLVSEKIAIKYFDNIDEAIGKVLLLDRTGFKVSGVMKDQPKTSHLFFDMLIPFEAAEVLPEFKWLEGWGSNSLVTYVELDQTSSAEKINSGFEGFLQRHVFSDKDGWEYLEMYLQPVSEIYLKSGHIKFQKVSDQGDSGLVAMFIVISILILLIACVNFINIAIARSFKRSREVGMRKVLGAGRHGLIVQFISESAILTLASMLIALGIVELVLPELNKFLGTEFSIQFLQNPLFNIDLVMLFIVMSFISGYYPAFYLSHLQPIDVLKGNASASGKGTGMLSRVLVVFQFVISIGLIFAVLVIRDQVDFIKNKDLGINYKDAFYIDFGEKGYEKLAVVKSAILQNPSVKSVAGCSFLNGVAGNQGPVFVSDSAKTKMLVRFGFVDEDFFNAMDIKFADGRNFDGKIPSDLNRACIINQAAAKALGWDNAIGKTFEYPGAADSSGKMEVIGVIDDYHYYSLRSQVEPALWGWLPHSFHGVVVKMAVGADRGKLKSFIEKTWKEIFPGLPVNVIDALSNNAENYKKDQDAFMLFFYFSLISLVLSCLGLFGLTSLILEQKTKSIGIRKVLGGEVWQITYFLTRNYLVLVLVAGAIALPLSYYLLEIQLNEFAYRINIGIWHMVLPVVTALLISFLTIAYRAYKAADTNPVEALKYE